MPASAFSSLLRASRSRAVSEPSAPPLLTAASLFPSHLHRIKHRTPRSAAGPLADIATMAANKSRFMCGYPCSWHPPEDSVANLPDALLHDLNARAPSARVSQRRIFE